MPERIFGNPSRERKSRTNLAASPEWAALLECSSPHPDLARLGKLLGEASAPELLDLAEAHGVVALLAPSLRHYEAELDPPGIAQKIRDAHRAQVLASLKMTAELFRLAGLFRDSGLAAMLVKGPALAVRAYGDAGARQYGDLDFLLRQRDILRGTELMIAAGYKPEISLDAIRAQKIPGQYLFVRVSAPASNRAAHRSAPCVTFRGDCRWKISSLAGNSFPWTGTKSPRFPSRMS